MGTPVLIQNAVCCYPHLWEPHSFDATSDPKWQIELHFSPGDANHKALQAAMEEVLRDVGKQDYASQIHPPWSTGEEVNARRATKGKAPRPEVQGRLLITPKDSQYPPVVVAQDGRTPIPKEQSQSIFSGCVVNAQIDVYWSKNPQNPGLFCGLRGVQLVDNVNVTRIEGDRGEVTFAPVEGAPAPIAPSGDSWM